MSCGPPNRGRGGTWHQDKRMTTQSVCKEKRMSSSHKDAQSIQRRNADEGPASQNKISKEKRSFRNHLRVKLLGGISRSRPEKNKPGNKASCGQGSEGRKFRVGRGSKQTCKPRTESRLRTPSRPGAGAKGVIECGLSGLGRKTRAVRAGRAGKKPAKFGHGRGRNKGIAGKRTSPDRFERWTRECRFLAGGLKGTSNDSKARRRKTRIKVKASKKKSVWSDSFAPPRRV